MDISAIRAFAIKEGASEESLVKRPLTWDEFSRMEEAESHWHCVANSKNVDAVHEAHSSEVASTKAELRTQVRKLHRFEVEDVPALANKMVQAGGDFSRAYPQFPLDNEECKNAILRYLKENVLLPTAENFAVAFKALAHLGKMSVNPSKTGLSDETELSGASLQNSPHLNRLLQPVTPALVLERQVHRMSPEAFKVWDREQHGSKELPWAIREQIDKAFVTLVANHPEFRGTESDKKHILEYINKYSRTIDAKSVEAAFQTVKSELELNQNVVVQTESGSTWTGYEQMDGRTYTEKQESLRRKIGRMTDPEFREFVSHSPPSHLFSDPPTGASVQ
jgi:hypothetical protein